MSVFIFIKTKLHRLLHLSVLSTTAQTCERSRLNAAHEHLQLVYPQSFTPHTLRDCQLHTLYCFETRRTWNNIWMKPSPVDVLFHLSWLSSTVWRSLKFTTFSFQHQPTPGPARLLTGPALLRSTSDIVQSNKKLPAMMNYLDPVMLNRKPSHKS